MRVRARFVDAARNPRRLFWLAGRVVKLFARGEIGTFWSRARPRGISDREYRAWCRHTALLAIAPAPGPDTPALRVIALVDTGDASANSAIARTLGAQTLPFAAVLVRDAGGAIARLEDGSSSRDADGPEVAALAAWLERLGGRDAWLVWIADRVTLDDRLNASLAVIAGGSAGASLVYFDDDELDANGERTSPRFKSAWDEEQLLEANYLGPVVALSARTATGLAETGAGGPNSLWRALLSVTSRAAEAQIVHLPQVFVHRWPMADRAARHGEDPALVRDVQAAAARLGANATFDADRLPRVRYADLVATDGVSIVIPTRDRSDLLRRCVDSLLATIRSPRIELVIVDNGSIEPTTHECFREIAARIATRIVAVPGPFNFPRLCNAGVAASRLRIVTLLNNDTCVVDPGWLDELASLAQRPRTGAVGPCLIYEDGLVQAAGIFVGVNRIATNVLAGFAPDSPVVRAWCATRRQVSAVAGACLAIERTKYLEVGGMDERYAISLNEIDLCLRLEQGGYVNVFTPFARIVHREGASRGFDLLPEERARLAVEERRFRANWGPLLNEADPAHNPNLCRLGNPFRLDFDAKHVASRRGWRVSLLRGPSTVVAETTGSGSGVSR